MKKIFGHRGMPRVYFENSLSGLNRAFSFADYVETDVRLTKDKQLILFHDPHIQNSLIKDLTVLEIGQMLTGIEVEEIILNSRNQILGNVNFEIKTDSLEPHEIDILCQKMSSIVDSIDIVTSFNWKAIQDFKDIFPSRYGIILHQEEELYQAKSISIHDDKIFFMLHHELIDSRNFDLPLDRTVAWTVNDQDDFQRFMEMNLYGVVTDIPDTMQLYRK